MLLVTLFFPLRMISPRKGGNCNETVGSSRKSGIVRLNPEFRIIQQGSQASSWSEVCFRGPKDDRRVNSTDASSLARVSRSAHVNNCCKGQREIKQVMEKLRASFTSNSNSLAPWTGIGHLDVEGEQKRFTKKPSIKGSTRD